VADAEAVSVNPADESGLGESTLGTGPSDRDFEIQPREFTLLNERIAEAHGWTPTSLSISSMQRDEGAIIYATAARRAAALI
jgi:hypothetical protein